MLSIAMEYCIGVAVKRTVDTPIAILKSVLAVVSSVSPSSEQGGDYGLGESLYIGRGCTDL